MSKCLLKLTKNLASSLRDLNINYLLRDIHRFLETKPVDGWALRTIKTLLSEIVQLKGQSVLKHLTLVPSSPTPTIVQYINLMLKQLPASKSGTEHSDQDTKAILTDIFKKIGSKETIQQGLVDLYRFKKDHPRIDIQPYLQRTSPHFQAYIKRALEQIERQNEPQPLATATNSGASLSSSSLVIGTENQGRCLNNLQRFSKGKNLVFAF